MGDEEGVAREAREAIHEGVPLADLREVLLGSYLFIGYPRAISALGILRREAGELWGPLVAEADVTAEPDQWRSRGEDLCRQVYGESYEKLVENIRDLHPDLADWMVTEGYGKVLGRPHLPALERELAVLGILAAMGAGPQLTSHLKGALRLGATPTQLSDTLEAVAQIGSKEARDLARNLLGEL